MDLRNKRIAVTGGKGFLGQHLIRKLKERGCRHVAVADLPEFDLIHIRDVRRMYRELKPDVVIHLAAKVGGIGFNQQNPASLFYENAMMGIQLLHEGYARRIDKFVALGTICAYPKFTPVPFNEDAIWDGYPEETNAPYGLAKKMMLVQSQAYRQQYGFNSIFLLPVNLYGPGDNFRFASSHVIPALIRKFHLAQLLSRGDFQGIIRDLQVNGELQRESRTIKRKLFDTKAASALLGEYGISLSGPSRSTHPHDVAVSIWGTGKATREFFYVEDAAEAIVLATERYDKSEPVNIGAGFEISIKDLVALIVKLMGFKGAVLWDATKPDGQPRRMLDTRRAAKEFGFKAKTSFHKGLRKTIEWYRQHVQ
ncbi:MAG: GDP-L-fucose synthase [Syntrophorhabdaceae bacterium]|nr:GDP-L-fucose synthase [Syntrophorhabdaceae bacterium]